MPRLLAWLATLALGLFSHARAEAPLPFEPSLVPGSAGSPFETAVLGLRERARQASAPREELESLSLLAALSMVHILEAQGRYEPFDPDGGEPASAGRWLYAGERVARVREEEFPEYFELERTQRELGMWVGADDRELDQRLRRWRVPRALARGVDRLVERARMAG